MHSRTLGLLLVFVSSCGGAGTVPVGEPPVAPLSDTTAPPSTPSTDKPPSLEKGPDSGKVDRVGTADGSLKPDGTNDVSFVTDVEGTVAAVFLVAVDDNGAPNGKYQADTLVGQAESPKELGAKPGSGTAGLGVADGDKLLNAADGSLPELGTGKHHLVLYVAPAPTLQSGAKVRVYFQRPDKTLVAGKTATN